MPLSNRKMLLTSCCDKLLMVTRRNSSTAIRTNQTPFACGAFSSSTSLNLISTGSKGGSYKSTSQQFVTFSTFKLRSSYISRLLFVQDDELNQANNLKVNSVKNYHNCKRHYSNKLSLNQQFLIDLTNQKEEFENKDNQLIEKQVLNKSFLTSGAVEPNSIGENSNKVNHKFNSSNQQYVDYQSSKNKLNSKLNLVNSSKFVDQLSTEKFVNSNFNSSSKSNLNSNLKFSSNSNLSSNLKINQSSKNQNSKNQSNTLNQTSNDHNPSIGHHEDYQDLINVRSIYRNNLLNQSDQFNEKSMSKIPFKPKKALILTKFSRLEYERKRLEDYTEEEIKENLIRRGSDYEGLLNHHNIHTKSKEHVAKTLSEFDIEYRIVNRFEYNQDQIDWADVIITTGGDGTFLMAASKIFNKDKLVIGINSDPSRSVGYLCLQPNYSVNFKSALEKLASGDFRWVYRQRVRISIKGENAMDAPAELHDQQLLHPEFRYLDLETHPLNRRSNSPHRPDNFEYEYQVLPVRALNDVFVGECLSSRVSYFELKIEDKSFVKVKSSGVTICTGTGSTSWSFNINKISPQSISTLFKIINKETNANLDSSNEQLTKTITKKFNDSLIFDVCKNSMAYTVRDPVYLGDGFESDNRGFAENIVIKSRMFDASVVIDGGLSYKFNDGSFAKFEILEEDQLKTVAF